MKHISNFLGMEVAIIDARDGSVELHTLPQSVKTDEDLQDYLTLTLEVNSDSEWIVANKIPIRDFRSK